ncbi:MAG TPA: hypothetical protein PLQ00_02455 [Thermoguttaceae bacterium]|nr:hypothetical protein [Thermoguttaceae bacterium]
MRRRLATSFMLIGAVVVLAGGCASLPWAGGSLWSGAASKENVPSLPPDASENGSSASGEASASAQPHSAAQRRSKSSPKLGDRKDGETNSTAGRAECSDAHQTGVSTRRDSSATASSEPSVEELQALMQQLQELALLDPEAQKLLMEDLSKTDPALWKPLMERFRAALEYHRRWQRSASSDKGRTKAAVSDSRKNTAAETAPGDTAAGGVDISAASQARETTGEPKVSSDGPKNLGSTEKNSDSSERQEASQKTAPAASSNLAKGGSGEIAQVGYVQEAGASSSQVRRLPPPTLQGTRSGGPMESLTSLPGGAGAGDPGTNARGETGARISAPPTGEPRRTAEQPSPGEQTSWQQRLTLLLREMEMGLSPTPQTDEEIARHVYYRLLCLAAGRRDEALQPIPGAPPAMQDFWSHEFYAIHLLLDDRENADRRQRAAEAKRLFQEAAGKLAVAAPLTLRGLAFATEVQSFGCYGGFDKYEFQPGQEVLLYAEVENFQSQPTPKGFHTKLRSRYQIFNAEGHSSAEQEFPVTEEYCRQIRRDFFIAYPVRLPQDLPPGRYTLKLSLEDLHRGEVCQGSIEFTIRKTKS